MFEDLIDELMYSLRNNKKKIILVILWISIFWSVFWFLYKTYIHETVVEIIEDKILKNNPDKIKKSNNTENDTKTPEKNEYYNYKQEV